MEDLAQLLRLSSGPATHHTCPYPSKGSRNGRTFQITRSEKQEGKGRDTRLTMRNVAPSSTAFTLTSRSTGNWRPKSSASVRASRSSPPHCLLMRPTLRDSSLVFTCWEGRRTPLWKTPPTPPLSHSAVACMVCVNYTQPSVQSHWVSI